MTAYNPDEVERLIEIIRRIGSAEHRPCPDCSCYACADCHCSLEHARRDRELAMADQLEAARQEIARLEECDITRNGGPYQIVRDCVHISTRELEGLRAGAEAAPKIAAERDMARADVLRLTETARAAAENWMGACRQRDEARAALREACTMLRGCRSGDSQPTVTTSKIDALIAVASSP